MSILTHERQILNALVPGLDATLAGEDLQSLEQPSGVALRHFREAHGPALLIPKACGGIGASALEAVWAQCALAARSPSLGVATTMHHFSVATLVQYSLFDASGEALLSAIAGDRLLVASGFAEGRPGATILEAQMTARWNGEGYTVDGSKKPCSLSRSMQILSAGVTIVRKGKPDRRGVAILLAGTPGIERKPFWNTPILAGAESDELVVRDVKVSADQVIESGDDAQLGLVELGGFCWFTLLISATYLGIAGALIERALGVEHATPESRVALSIEMEGAMSALEGLSARIERGPMTPALLRQAASVRYAIQAAIERATDRAVEMLGGLAFIRSPDVSYLLACSRALAFHPPQRRAMLHELDAALRTNGVVPAASSAAEAAARHAPNMSL